MPGLFDMFIFLLFCTSLQRKKLTKSILRANDIGILKFHPNTHTQYIFSDLLFSEEQHRQICHSMDLHVNSFMYFSNFVVWEKNLYTVNEKPSKQSTICLSTNIHGNEAESFVK